MFSFINSFYVCAPVRAGNIIYTNIVATLDQEAGDIILITQHNMNHKLPIVMYINVARVKPHVR